MSEERFERLDQKVFVMEAFALAVLRVVAGFAMIALFCKYVPLAIGFKIIGSIAVGLLTDELVGRFVLWYVRTAAKYSPEWKDTVGIYDHIYEHK